MPGPPSRGTAFIQLRDFVRHDVKNVLGMEHGGNYTAALLLLVGAEALSRIVDSADDDAFVEILHRRGLDPLVAHDVFEALRHGLAHSFETKYIQVGNIHVELVVSWGAREHLSRGLNPPKLFLNVRTMWDDLQVMLAEVEKRLIGDHAWAAQIPEKSRRSPSPHRRPLAGSCRWSFYSETGFVDEPGEWEVVGRPYSTADSQ